MHHEECGRPSDPSRLPFAILNTYLNGDVFTNSWFKVNGNNGFYWQNWGGGFYMNDNYWIRTYNNNGIWLNSGNFGTNGGITVGYGGGNPPAGGAIFAGNVGVGTNNPTSLLTVAGMIQTTSGGVKFPDGTVQTTSATASGGPGAKAWVNFDGTTCPTSGNLCTIRRSFNVSSVVRSNCGGYSNDCYTVNFATSMPDANYVAIGSTERDVEHTTVMFNYYNGSMIYSASAVQALTATDYGRLWHL